MATPVQEITITYAGYGVGGSSGRVLEAYHTFEIGTVTTAIEFSFVIGGIANSADLATAIAAAELAFNTPYSALTVVQSGSTLLSLSHSASTGFNSMPRIIKTESLADTGRSRRYVVRIDFGMPATNYGTSYRRESSVRIEYSASRRRRLIITAVYTANGATGARAQALSAGPTYAGTVRTAITGTWDGRSSEFVDADDQDKVATWSATYNELIFSDAGSADDTTLVDGQLAVTRNKTAPGDFGTARRLATVTLNYSVSLDSSASTAILTKFDSIRGWFVTQMQNTLGSGSLAIVQEDVTPDYPNNSLVVVMVGKGTTGGTILEASFETEDFSQEGGVLVGVWSGRKFDKHLFQGEASYVRTETATQVLLGNLTILQLMDAGATGIGAGSKDAIVVGQEPGPSGLDNFIRVSKRPKISHERQGLTGNQFDVTKVVAVTITAWFTKPVASGGNFATVDAHPEISGRRAGS